MATGKHVVIVGLGNTGSAACTLIARDPNVSKMTLIDQDQYEAKNIVGQSITQADFEQSKVFVQARNIKQIRPDIEIVALACPVEQVPVGMLISDVICSCLDSRISRMFCNLISRRLGIAMVDVGVLSDQQLVRANTHIPTPESNCLECSMGDAEYKLIEVVRPCDGSKGMESRIASTNAPASLGALAGGLMAVEVAKILSGDIEHSLAGKQFTVSLKSYTHLTTRLPRNPQCRMDHSIWTISEAKLTLDSRFSDIKLDDNFELAILGGRFITGRTCLVCKASSKTIAFVRRGGSCASVCTECGGECSPFPFDWTSKLTASNIRSNPDLGTLGSIGARDQDLCTVSTLQGSEHFVISA